MLKPYSFLFLLVAVLQNLANASTSLPNYYPTEFKSQLQAGIRDVPLKEQLFEILNKAHVTTPTEDTLVDSCQGMSNCRQHTSLGYKGARRVMFGSIFLNHGPAGYEIKDVYCQVNYSEKDFTKEPPGPDRIPDSEILNAEHSWPQSKFNSQFPGDLQKSDLHILFPVSKNANSMRSNFQMANVSQIVSSPCAGAKRGLNENGGGTTYFEPPDAQKGATARAILYFSVRYKLPVQAIEEVHLRQWNRDYPVDSFERDRNQQIYEAQHNRNPFVDDPELVDRISDF